MPEAAPTRTLAELSEQLDLEQDRIMLALEACGAGIWDWDMINDQLHWGVGMKKLFGVAHFGGRYADFERCLEPLDSDLVRANLKYSIENRTVFDCSFRLTSRPGVVIRGRGKCYYVSGAPVRFVGVNVEETANRPVFCPIAYPGCPSHIAAILAPKKEEKCDPVSPSSPT